MKRKQATPKNPRRPNYIKAWRKDRGLTQEQVIDRLDFLGVPFSIAQLSRIERGEQEWRQDLLEALAEVLRTEVPSLIMRDPRQKDGLWSLVESLKPVEREQAERIIRAMRPAPDSDTGTGG